MDEAVVSDPIDVPVLTAEEEEALPTIALAKPSGSLNVSARSIALSTTVSPSTTTMVSCVAILDEDKQRPYDHVVSFTSGLNRTFSLTKETAHTLYGLFECVSVSGQTVRSSWSSG